MDRLIKKKWVSWFNPLARRFNPWIDPKNGPISPEEAKFFQTISQGPFLLHGFRNKDLLAQLYTQAEKNPVERRKISARISRHLRLLRAHGLISKVSKTHLYRLTKAGHEVIAVALKLRDSDFKNRGIKNVRKKTRIYGFVIRRARRRIILLRGESSPIMIRWGKEVDR